LANVQPPHQSVFLGAWRPGRELRLFPFLTEERQRLVEDRADRGATDLTVLAPSQITRKTLWASESFSIPELSLTIHTPFGPVFEPEGLDREEQRRQFCPALIAELTLDNRGSDEELCAVFGLSGVDHALSPWNSALAGVACGRGWGFAVERTSAKVSEHQAWCLPESVISQGEGKEGFHRLGSEGGLVVHTEPNTLRTLRIALGTWQEGPVTSGLEAKLFYSTCFTGLQDVLAFALGNAEFFLRSSVQRNAELEACPLSADRRFLLAHATRSYLANTEFLVTAEGRTIFLVNEGEYRMMNTLDLVVDQAFWELRYHPWTVRNELETALGQGSYHDAYGLCFCHDLGVGQAFSPPGTSSYELAGLRDCYSYMTFEELLNWILTAGMYFTTTGDFPWLTRLAPVLETLWDSLSARDTDGDGLMDLDSDRCWGGAEITTYDSLDTSLGQARKSLYLGVKTWAAGLTFARLFDVLGHRASAESAERLAKRAAATLVLRFDAAEGFIPAVFEAGNRSRIIPAVEALIYPWFLGDRDAVDPAGRFAPLLAVLKTHLSTVLQPGVCLDAQSGGWKLSSTSQNTWMSKIFLNQFVAKAILKMDFAEEAHWDAIHAGWMRQGCAEFAATDQVDSRCGRDLGSRLYPRLVTAILWMP